MDLFLTIIIVFLSLDFIIRILLNLLNQKNMRSPLPEEVKDIYEADRYEQSQEYQRHRSRVGLVSGAIGFLILVFLLGFQGFAWLDDFAGQFFDHPILRGLLFFSVLGLLSDVISLPFDAYNTFVIEDRFGFNRTTLKTFVLDRLKSWLLALLIGSIALSLLIGTWEWVGFWFWLPAWLILSLFILALSGYGSHFIAKLFNKMAPLEEGELKEKIVAFADRAGFPVSDIYVMDGSRRSSKANAYFSGLGKTKRIVLFDTLIEKLSTDEVVAVLAHEAGHFKKGHIKKLLFTSIVQSGFMLFLLALALQIPELSVSFGVDYHSFHIGLLAFVLLYTPISFVMGIFGNVISRRFEYEADAFTAQAGYANELIQALKRLSAESLSNLTPHPLYVFFNYSHPALAERLNHLKRKSKA